MTTASSLEPQGRADDPSDPAVAGPSPLDEQVAAAVLSVPAVVALAGVEVDDESVEVTVTTAYGPPLAEVASDIEARLRSLLIARRLHISITDILLPGEKLAVVADASDEPDAEDRTPEHLDGSSSAVNPPTEAKS